MFSGLTGGMKRVKTVRSVKRSARTVTTGATRSIQGAAQRPPGAKMLCISMHRCTADGGIGPCKYGRGMKVMRSRALR
jgi:hypothetical protein